MGLVENTFGSVCPKIIQAYISIIPTHRYQNQKPGYTTCISVDTKDTIPVQVEDDVSGSSGFNQNTDLPPSS